MKNPIIDALAFLATEQLREATDKDGRDVIAIGDDPTALDALIYMETSRQEVRAMIVRVLRHADVIKEVVEAAEETHSIQTENIARWGARRKSLAYRRLSDALAKLRAVTP